ncbi:MAG TPA: HNH endonuclease signature motif containing protein, partial [Gemmatales bacterium]|nr:HNH endonuclease signature motif containing protein [Gemmatales bacterium]
MKLVDHLLRCPECKGIILQRSSGVGRKKQFCSATCYNKSYQRKHYAARKPVIQAARRPSLDKTCGTCGKNFVAKAVTANFCSKKCSDYHFNHRQTNVCYQCGEFFKTTNPSTAETCSRRCRVLYFKDSKLVSKVCLVCGSAFQVGQYHAAFAKYCTRRCTERAANKLKEAYRTNWHRTRAAREKETEVERINPFVVFERDNWTCWLCNTACDREAAFPHPRSATMDHVVPVSKGGSHVLDNLRCAHNLC